MSVVVRTETGLRWYGGVEIDISEGAYWQCIECGAVEIEGVDDDDGDDRGFRCHSCGGYQLIDWTYHKELIVFHVEQL